MDSLSEFMEVGENLDVIYDRKYVDSRFEFLLNKLESQNQITVDCLEKIYEFTRIIDKRVKEVDQSFIPVNSKLNNIENRIRNSRAYHPFDDIYPISLCTPYSIQASYFDVPNKFPNKVIQFWLLKQPKKLSTLTALLHFYGITGWEYWGEVDKLLNSCEDDTEDDQPQFHILRAAVEQYPEAALSFLANHLGLNFSKIKKSVSYLKYGPRLEKIEKHFEKRNAQDEVGDTKAKTPRLEDQTSVKTSPRASQHGYQSPILTPETHPKERTYNRSSQVSKVEWDATISSLHHLSSTVLRQVSDENESDGETLSESSEDETDVTRTK